MLNFTVYYFEYCSALYTSYKVKTNLWEINLDIFLTTLQLQFCSKNTGVSNKVGNLRFALVLSRGHFTSFPTHAKSNSPRFGKTKKHKKKKKKLQFENDSYKIYRLMNKCFPYLRNENDRHCQLWIAVGYLKTLVIFKPSTRCFLCNYVQQTRFWLSRQRYNKQFFLSNINLAFNCSHIKVPVLVKEIYILHILPS